MKLPRRRAAPALLAALLCAGAVAAHAAPEQPAAPTSSDAVLQLLQDKGLVQQVRQVTDRAGDMVVSAMAYLGVPYRRGGGSAEDGFDCSGFTRHVFENTVGLLLPRRADQQAKSPELAAVDREALKPGDLVFFNTMRRAFSHVGIYVGEGRFIHAPRSGGEVRIEDMRAAYWAKRFNGARRADLPADPATSATEAALR
jgi:cell wall-associated NlpC family hydrolase